jgi:hypothetical protein
MPMPHLQSLASQSSYWMDAWAGAGSELSRRPPRAKGAKCPSQRGVGQNRGGQSPPLVGDRGAVGALAQRLCQTFTSTDALGGAKDGRETGRVGTGQNLPCRILSRIDLDSLGLFVHCLAGGTSGSTVFAFLVH